MNKNAMKTLLRWAAPAFLAATLAAPAFAALPIQHWKQASGRRCWFQTSVCRANPD